MAGFLDSSPIYLISLSGRFRQTMNAICPEADKEARTITEVREDP
jgi:hypothetical protein